MLLAVVSTVFGMMMAVASDLPALENRKEYQDARNSVLYDYTGKQSLGVLTNNQSRVLVTYDQIAPDMRNAIVAIEDRRFYKNSGVDIRGIGARVRPGRRPAARGAGRLDDHPAVREERAARPEPAHDLPEAPRGGARLPPDAQVVEARRSSRST